MTGVDQKIFSSEIYINSTFCAILKNARVVVLCPVPEKDEIACQNPIPWQDFELIRGQLFTEEHLSLCNKKGSFPIRKEESFEQFLIISNMDAQ